MKRILALAVLCAAFSACNTPAGDAGSGASGSADPTVNLVPVPVSFTQSAGHYTLPSPLSVSVQGTGEGLDSLVARMKNKIETATGYKITSAGSSGGSIAIVLNKEPDSQLGSEGYKLQVNKDGISILANNPAGIFYGIQTLWQLFPAAIESKMAQPDYKWTLPLVDITDYPRFGWRGLMLDVARHFFTKQEVERYIDDMVRYKYNILHLHLTDDQGWRIEIKSLPKLTEVGAWNVKKVGHFGDFTPPAPDAPRNYGGFYTQDDIREIVRYAKERFVNILPEIDVPGHSLAAVAAYPDLSCTPGTYRVNSGEKFMDWHKGGFSALVDNTLCPANDKVYEFLDKVFTEVSQLFPFGYIHMGGDECAKNFWEKSAAIKALMKKENLKTMEEVQSYFVKRVEKIIESKGKKMIGWDEILEGGLAPNAAVMSWRGVAGGIAAAKMGHEVVMSPTTFAYLDYVQGDPLMEPPVYASLRLKKCYEFEPVPDSVDPKFILGGQANLWTEQVYNLRQAEYMTWPRAMAIAEDVWSPKDKKNWNNFVTRVEGQLPHMDAAEIKVAPSMFEPDIQASKDKDGHLQVTLVPEIEGLDLYYSFDNSYPDNFYPKYSAPVPVPEDATTLRVVAYKNGKKVSRFMTIPVTELQKRAEPKK